MLSHPIQYFSPLFQLIAKEPDIDLLVLYCSDENVDGHLDKDFGVNVNWDIPLLVGYNYKFLKNNSWKPSIFNGFFGLMNFEIFKYLKKEKGNYLVVHGWNYLTNILAIFYGKFSGIKICIRGDNSYKLEIQKSKFKQIIKKILLGKILFRFIDYFLYVGKQNKQYFEFYKVSDNKLIFTPHAVDNQRFTSEYEKYKVKKNDLKTELGLPVNKRIILSVGKYINVKRPFDLLNAFELLDDKSAALVLLGDGNLRKKMEKYINDKELNDVFLTGFKNQSEVGKYFTIADIFVLISESETWGLSVNEAFNFNLPAIVSNMVGCVDDLVIDGSNGFIIQCGDIESIKNKLRFLLTDENMRINAGKSSRKIINNFSYEAILKSLRQIA